MPDFAKYYYKLTDWAVETANARFFHIAKTIVYPNGSGDTSYGWAALWLFIIVAFAGAIIWSVLDWRRKNYQHANYWLCLLTRYYIALTAFGYGFAKVLALQMPFPGNSQLATPLGDFLPMRFSWAVYWIFNTI